jgi:hypothetical protein
VLRIRPEALASAWWHVVRRQRVEVTAQEATQALTWARSVDGSAAADPKPPFIHHPGSLHA